MAIDLFEWTVEAWKNGRCQWKFLGFKDCICSVEGGEQVFFHMHVVCCYAPTRAASREDKDRFFDLLGDVL